MNSKYWNKSTLGVLLGALIYAGCCPKVINVTRTQGHILVVIDSNQVFHPDDIYVEVGDMVLYKAEETTLLCAGPVETFGGTEYRIQAGEILQLKVQARPQNDGRFITRALRGDTAVCGPGGEEGGGKVGGG